MSTDAASGPSSPQPSGAPLARIVAATDFSPTAEAALDWALDLAGRHGARLTLLHALTLPAPLPDYVPPGGDFGDELQGVARRKLEETAARLGERGVEVAVELSLGVPSQTIVAFAQDSGADLVVVGTRGLTGIGHLLLGSTAERVVQRARCPVLTVHPEDRGRHRPLRTIVLPTDFSAGSADAAAFAVRLLARLEADARIVLVHAYHLPIEYTAYGPIPTSVRFLQDVGADAEAKLELAARELAREGLAVEAVSREGYPPDVIVDEARRRDADLVAMGTHGRTGLAHLLLGSTAERVVQHAPCPVITVRQRDED
ncbi:MAG TPA: universal stress protein [Thermoanaerobaculia bacterium]|nr:universal stress protein [Thermoanaerobaculia bacterium]